MYSISELQEEVAAARSRHIASDGAEWVRLVFALKTLSEAYSSQGMYEDAAACDKESNAILGNVQDKNSSPFPLSKNEDSVLTFFDETNRWAKKAEESRTELENGGSPTKYANTVIALCEYLCLSGQTKIALLKYEEDLRVLLSKSPVNGVERELTYQIMVILLKASECALDLGNESLSRRYSVYPLLYLAEKADKDNWDSSSINWSYVADLCKTLINKQLRYENR